MDVTATVDALKRAFDAAIEMERRPVEIRRSRDGWAAYKGAARITRFFFSAQGAMGAAESREAAGVQTTFTDF